MTLVADLATPLYQALEKKVPFTQAERPAFTARVPAALPERPVLANLTAPRAVAGRSVPSSMASGWVGLFLGDFDVAFQVSWAGT